MAEAAILLALEKLGLALGGELLTQARALFSRKLASFAELPNRMERIGRVLLVMRGFLLHNDNVDSKNPTIEAWIEQVRNVAYTIEDIVDHYISLIPQDQQRQGGLVGYMKRVVKKPKSFGSFYLIASQLEEVEKDLDQISKLKDQWIQTTGFGDCSSSRNVSEWTQHLMGSSSLFMDEEQLVGIDENRDILTYWLRSEELNLCIITVWGMGGLGKTTLVTNVYKRESKNFECHARISISQTFEGKVEDLLRNMINQLYGDQKIVPTNTATMDVQKLTEIVREFVQQKKYLIVLDDVWVPEAFYVLRDSLVDNQKGSRILITTRIAEVASLANRNYKLELKPLSPFDAWKLFCRRAFRNYENQECPPELEKSARDIVDKCEGLPLAIVSLGNLLSLRENSEAEWKRVYDQLNWELTNHPSLDPIRNVLNLSFNRLPRHLKNCFLSCSMFPEDYILGRKMLIRLWIAEGFAVERGSSTAEEVAEGYLAELIRWSMLQLVEKNHFDRVKSCRMHDLVRELAISLSKREKFHSIYEDNGRMVDANARRLSVLKCSSDTGFNNNLLRLRTFVAFDTTMPSSSLLSVFPSNSRYIAILELQGLPIEEVPDAIGDLFNLRHLGLRDTKVKSLPKSIGKLSNLLTLDLGRSAIQKLPREITNLKKLRHMFVDRENDPTGKSFRWETGVHAPKGLWNLKELQTLQAVEASGDLVRRLGNLTNLRSFRIWNVKKSYSAQLCASLSQMHSLSYLSINASDENEFLNLEGLNPPPPNLKKLILGGRLAAEMLMSPLFQDHGKNLRQLSLSWSQLAADPLPSLAHLSNLTHLYLERAYNGEQLNFRAQWFPHLSELQLVDLPQLQRVKIEMTAMSNLKSLYLRSLINLTEVPEGIEFLTSLQKLYLIDLNPQLNNSLEDNDKLRRISSIYIYRLKNT